MRTSSTIGLCVGCLAVGIALGMWLSPSVPGLDTAPICPDPEPNPDSEVLVGPKASRADSGSETPPTGTPCPACPEPRPCPACDAPAEAPACPTETALCATHRAKLRSLAEKVGEAEARLAEAEERLTKRGPAGRYDDPTVQGRRRMAAARDNLLLEIPSWGDDYALPRKVAEKHVLSAADRAALENAYRGFQRDLYADLRELLVELTGDPAAGESATLNALIHDILGLSPRPLCRERMLAVTSALAAGAPLPRAGTDAPACELLILALYAAVDQVDADVRGELGDDAAAALWSGTSTFEFSTRGRDGDDPAEP